MNNFSLLKMLKFGIYMEFFIYILKDYHYYVIVLAIKAALKKHCNIQ